MLSFPLSLWITWTAPPNAASSFLIDSPVCWLPCDSPDVTCKISHCYQLQISREITSDECKLFLAFNNFCFRTWIISFTIFWSVIPVSSLVICDIQMQTTVIIGFCRRGLTIARFLPCIFFVIVFHTCSSARSVTLTIFCRPSQPLVFTFSLESTFSWGKKQQFLFWIWLMSYEEIWRTRNTLLRRL